VNTPELLALVAGVSALAGLNLYLTVFATGLVLRLQWFELPEPFAALDILAHPAVLTVAGVMVVVEFIADKIPWFDSLWDGLHTLIRPLGAAGLSAGLATDQDPAVAVIAALVGGGAALTTHTGKAGLRLAVNTSPEPVSNSLLSLLEDALVLLGLWLIAVQPWVAAGLALAAVLLAFWVVLWALRYLRMHAGLLGLWFSGPSGAESASLPLAWRQRLDETLAQPFPLLRSEPAYALRVRGVPAFSPGAAVRLDDRIGWTNARRAVLLPVEGLEVHVRRRLWFDEVSWFSPAERWGLSIRVRRGRGETLARWTAPTFKFQISDFPPAP
jgi:hypothetical protein